MPGSCPGVGGSVGWYYTSIYWKIATPISSYQFVCYQMWNVNYLAMQCEVNSFMIRHESFFDRISMISSIGPESRSSSQKPSNKMEWTKGCSHEVFNFTWCLSLRCKKHLKLWHVISVIPPPVLSNHQVSTPYNVQWCNVQYCTRLPVHQSSTWYK